MNIIESITNGMEKVSVIGVVPEKCLLCEFCDLYQADKRKCAVHQTIENCPAGKNNILIKATVLGTKTNFHYAYCKALNSAVLLSVWNYTTELVTTPDGSVKFLTDLKNAKEQKPMEHTPTPEMLNLGIGFADEVQRTWKIMMAYQLQKRTVKKDWWVNENKGYVHYLENPYGNNIQKVVKDHVRPQDCLPYETRMRYIIKEFIALKEKYSILHEATDRARAENKTLKGFKVENINLKASNEKLKKENIRLREEMANIKKTLKQLSKMGTLTEEQ